MSQSKMYPVLNPLKEFFEDDKIALKDKISRCSETPLKEPMAYFNDYFSKGGQEERPTLGNLEEFAKAIQKEWEETGKEENFGMNYVVGLIHARCEALREEALDEGNTL